MKFEVFTTEEFLKDVKSITKTYPDFKHDILKIISQLQENPEQGVARAKAIHRLMLKV